MSQPKENKCKSCGRVKGEHFTSFCREFELVSTEPSEEWEIKLIEQLADIEHQRWSHWQKYLHSKCTVDVHGNLIIPKSLVEHWERQMFTDYVELSESEKDSDRNEVHRYFHLIRILQDQTFKDGYYKGIEDESVNCKEHCDKAVKEAKEDILWKIQEELVPHSHDHENAREGCHSCVINDTVSKFIDVLKTHSHGEK